jgi:hypothetical protein
LSIASPRFPRKDRKGKRAATVREKGDILLFPSADEIRQVNNLLAYDDGTPDTKEGKAECPLFQRKHCSFFIKPLILRQILTALYKKVNPERDIKSGGYEKNSFFLVCLFMVI